MAVGPINTVGKDPVQPSDPESRRGAPNQDDAARLREALETLGTTRGGSDQAKLLALAMEMQKWTLKTDLPSEHVQMLSDQLKSTVQKMR